MSRYRLLRYEFWFEPTDVKKAMKAFNKGYAITFASPNLNELRAIAGGLVGSAKKVAPQSSESILKEAVELSQIILNRTQAVFVTLGKLGVLAIKLILPKVSRRGSPNEPLLVNSKERNPSVRLYQAPVISTFRSVSGAGDWSWN
ncbi:hypothetical protein J437_LFUL016234 [Ladona fulva]|uniref:Uncharacterized protein n=1 Tax=Ladona fulva TaxID=123851 RepID=A0A8K0KND1_LADFU|nr:hypothetical protein J437_LFUL016234 [Ladona fulva]